MKLPRYEPSIGTRESIPFQQAPLGLGADAWRGVDQALQGAGQLGRIYAYDKAQQRQKEREEAMVWANRVESEYQLESVKQTQKAVQEMPEGGAGFAQSMDVYHETRRRQLRDEAPSPLAGDILDLKLGDHRAREFGRNMGIEMGENTRYKFKQIGETINNNSLYIYEQGGIGVIPDMPVTDDPKEAAFNQGKYGVLGQMRNKNLAAIHNSGASREAQDKMIAAMDRDFAQAHLKNRLNNTAFGENNYRLDKDIKSGRMAKFFEGAGITADPEMLQQYMTLAETKMRAQNASLRDQVEYWMKNSLDSIAIDGTEVEPPFERQTMTELVGAEKMQWYDDQKEIRVGIRSGVDSILSDPRIENVNKVLNDYRNKASGLNTSKNKEILDVLEKTAANVQEMLFRDGYSLAMKAIQNANLQIQDRSGVWHDQTSPYARAEFARQYQKFGGVPDSHIKVMPVEQAKMHAKTIQELQPEGVQAYMAQMRKDFQELQPFAERQLYEAGLPEEYKTINWSAETAVGNNIAAVAGQAIAEVEKASGLPQPELSNIKQRVNAELRPFLTAVTYADTAGNNNTFVASVYGTVYKAVVNDIRGGADAGAAIKRYMNELVYSRYYIKDTYVIPKYISEPTADGGTIRSQINDRVVINNLETKRREVEKFGVATANMFSSRLPAGDQYDAMVRRAQEKGYWLLNENADGVYLALDKADGTGRGVPVLNGSGARYEFKFVDLNRSGPTASGTIRRPPSSDTPEVNDIDQTDDQGNRKPGVNLGVPKKYRP